jgi:hypothetical protein
MRTTVLNNQSLIDIAIQECGSVDAVFQIALLNGRSITDDLVVGDELRMPPAANTAIAQYYENKALKPATSITGDMLDILGSVWDSTFDSTFGIDSTVGNSYRIFDYTFSELFE